MNWFKATLALALAAFWPLAASHCNLELISDLGFLACGQQEQTDSHENSSDCHSDGCAVIEGGLYKTEERQVTAPPPVVALLCALNSPVTEESISAGIPIPAPSPPELPALWQFTQRAAAPPRAPSLVS